jgi:hypothetical protein
MAENNDAQVFTRWAERNAPRTEYRVKTFMRDGLFNVCGAYKVAKELREGGTRTYMDVGGIYFNFVTRIANRGWLLSQRGNRREATLSIGLWAIVYIPREDILDECVKSIWHHHLTSDFLCATFPTDERKWWCCACKEPVPPGVIWAARTDGLRRGR